MELSEDGNQQGVQTRIDDDGVVVPVNGSYLMTLPVRVEAGQAVLSDPSTREVVIEAPLGALVECGAVFSDPSEVPGALAEELLALRQTVRLLRRAPITAERLAQILSEELYVGEDGAPFGLRVQGVDDAVFRILAQFTPPTTTEDLPDK